MFYPACMKQIRMVVLDEYRDALIRELHELGAVELRRLGDNDKASLLSHARMEERSKKINYALMRLSSVLETFKACRSVAKSAFSPPPPPEREGVEDKAPDELLAEAEDYLQMEAQLNRIKADLDELDAKAEEYSQILLFLGKLKFDFDLSMLTPSKRFFATAGELPASALPGIEEDEGVLVFSQGGEEVSVVVVGGLREDEGRIRAALKEGGFQEYPLEGIRGRPPALVEVYAGELEAIAKRREELRTEIQKLAAEHEARGEVIRELLEIEKERGEILGILGRTERTYFFEGYIPEKKVSELEDLLEADFKGYAIMETEEPEEPEEEIPVLLENPRVVKPFEMLTEMFAPPRYREFDPTTLFAPAFVIFFGIMLTDAVYGGIVVLAAWYLYRSVGRASPSVRDFGIILGVAGLSAVFFGIMFGSYLGDFFSPAGEDEAPAMGTKLLGLSISPLWMDPFQKELKYGLSPIIVLLLTSLIIGAAHINIGNFLGLQKAWRNKDVREFLGHAWLVIFQLGILCTLLGLNTIATALLVIAMVILFYNAGPMGFFGITGYLGDSLSYARLLALSLATGGIAIAINIMTGMIAGIPLVGTLFAVGYFIVGHLFNTALNTLGAFVHSLRLHYVEFFSKFYEGGGNKFKPFKVYRRYTRRLQDG